MPVPRPISKTEHGAIDAYLNIRKRAHYGPYYSVFDSSSLVDEKTGKTSKRLGFDPFNDQEKYTAKYHKKKRRVPDLSGRDYGMSITPYATVEQETRWLTEGL